MGAKLLVSWRSIRFDQAFAQGSFYDFIEKIDINYELVAKNRDYKNPIESKPGIIWCIFPGLKKDRNENEFDKIQTALKSVSIWDDLYGNNVISSLQLAKGHTRPLLGIANIITPYILEAQQNQIKMRLQDSFYSWRHGWNIKHSKVGDTWKMDRAEKDSFNW